MSETVAAWGEASSDAELITAARAGDSEAFGALYTRHAGATRAVAREYTRSNADAEDVVGDAFAKVYAVMRGGGGPDVAFRAYLFTVVRRLAHVRAESGRRVQPTDDVTMFETAFGPLGGVDDPALAGFERGVVARAYGSLPERWQAVLWYTEIERLPPAQVAPLLGLTANGVAALAYRAREGLREAYLQQHLAGAPTEACRAVNGKLGAYVRGGLAKRETAQVREHLELCAACRDLVLELGDVNHGLRGIIAPLVLGTAGLGVLSAPLPVGVLGSIGAAGSLAGTGGAGAGAATGAGGLAGAGTTSAGAAGAGAGTAGAAGTAAVGSVAGGSVAGGAAGSVGAGAGAVAAGAGATGAGTAAVAGAGATGSGLTATGAGLTAAGAAAGKAAAAVGVTAAGAGAAGGTAAGATAAAAGGGAAGATVAGATAAGATAAGATVAGATVAGATAAGATAAGTATAGAAAVGATAAGATAAGATAMGVTGAGAGLAGGGLGALVAAVPGGVAGAVTAGVVGVSLAVGGAMVPDSAPPPQSQSASQGVAVPVPPVAPPVPSAGAGPESGKGAPPQPESPPEPGAQSQAGQRPSPAEEQPAVPVAPALPIPSPSEAVAAPAPSLPPVASPTVTVDPEPAPEPAPEPGADVLLPPTPVPEPSPEPSPEPVPVGDPSDPGTPEPPTDVEPGPVLPVEPAPASLLVQALSDSVVLAPGSTRLVRVIVANTGSTGAGDLRAALHVPAGVLVHPGPSAGPDGWAQCADDAPGTPFELCLPALPGGADSELTAVVAPVAGATLEPGARIDLRVKGAGLEEVVTSVAAVLTTPQPEAVAAESPDPAVQPREVVDR